MIQFHQKYLKLLQEGLGGSTHFSHTLDFAMDAILNLKMKVSMSEMLSNYTNFYLKTGKKRLSDEEINARIQSIIRLFKNIQAKDLFIDIYRNQVRFFSRKSHRSARQKATV